MKCPTCGSDIAAGSTVCGACGSPVSTSSANPFSDESPQAPPLPPAPGHSMEDDLGVRMLIPIGRSVHAIIAGYLGLLSLGCCALGPFAILFGILAVVDIKKHPKKGGIVRAVLGIVLGTLGTLGLVAFLVAWLSGEM